MNIRFAAHSMLLLPVLLLAEEMKPAATNAPAAITVATPLTAPPVSPPTQAIAQERLQP